MAAHLTTRIADLPLKNPLICGSGEHTMTRQGLRALLAAGAAAVVTKSCNESEAARRQLDRTDYALLDSRWRRLPWTFDPPPDAQLFCRSGLAQQHFDEWLALVADADAHARLQDAYVIPSLILANLDSCIGFARRIEDAGLRVLELNIGAPHGEEAAKGAIALERDAERVRTITRAVRESIRLPLWIKLTGQSEDVAALAAAARDGGADAVVMMGRFMGFVPDLETQAPLLGTSAALGGPWALALTARWIASTRKRLGPEYPLVATNGARDGLDIARFLLAGARAVEMTSAVFTGGARVVARSLDELDGYLRQHGTSAAQLVGRAADRLGTYAEQPERPGHWECFLAPEARDPVSRA